MEQLSEEEEEEDLCEELYEEEASLSRFLDRAFSAARMICLSLRSRADAYSIAFGLSSTIRRTTSRSS